MFILGSEFEYTENGNVPKFLFLFIYLFDFVNSAGFWFGVVVLVLVEEYNKK